MAWAAVAAAGNALTRGNYMFLSERPETASLQHYMGPWPWYILGAGLPALAMFWRSTYPSGDDAPPG